MRIVLSWLREYVDWTGSGEQLADLLTRMGIEVEQIYHVYGNVDGCITAKILRAEPLAGSDHLFVCDVFDGERQRRIVCGAQNVADGQIAVLALPGTKLPSGIVVEERTIFGVLSEGMLCSQRELLWSDDHSGIWILDATTPVGIPLREIVADDTVLDISVTPNRADALSHYGIARVIAAATGQKTYLPTVALTESFEIPLAIELPEPHLCHRYAARMLREVQVISSPWWLRRRLELAGMRPRNVVVDVTNYVMLECGHPLHAFDRATIEGDVIVVRKAMDGERLITLDGIERTLDSSMLCICDRQRPLAIAGIMGGANSAITETTEAVLLESAYFTPTTIRRTANAVGLHTESAYRFERGTDIEMIPYALNRAAAMIAELTGARCSVATDAYPTVHEPTRIYFRLDRAEHIIGCQYDRQQVERTLTQLGFELEQQSGRSFLVNVPSYRNDIREEIDIIEELAIASDYASIEPSQSVRLHYDTSNVPYHLRIPPQRDRLRRVLAMLGFYEALHYTMHDPETLIYPESAIEVLNPLGRERSILRQWLLPSMVESLSRNCRYGQHSVRLFEIGTVFTLDSNRSSAQEHERIIIGCAGLAQQRHWLAQERSFDLYDLKGYVETLAQIWQLDFEWQCTSPNGFQQLWLGHSIIAIRYHGSTIGYIGQVDSRVRSRYDLPEATFIAELDTTPFYTASREQAQYVAPSSYPVVTRDVSLVVDRDVPVGALVQSLQRGGGRLVKLVEPFDVFEHPSLGIGKKSVALTLTFVSFDHTLTDDEVNATLQAAIDCVVHEHGARLRT